MAVVLDSGGGSTVTIEEPQRSDFADKLAGAFEFSMARLIYKVLDFAGDALGTFLSGVAVSFLDRIEPSLVGYARPLIDLLLDQDDLPEPIREFLSPLRDPVSAGAATVLSGLSQQAGGQIFGSVLAPIMAPVTYAINTLFRPTLPGFQDIVTMRQRGLITPDDSDTLFAAMGYKDMYRDALLDMGQLRSGVNDLMEGLIRGNIDQDVLVAELTARGIPNFDINLLLANTVMIPNERDIVQAKVMGIINTDMAHILLSRKGYEEDTRNMLIDSGRRLLEPQQIMQAVYRNELGIIEARALLLKHGLSELDVTTFLRSHAPVPGPGDLIRFGLREAYDDAVATTWGYDADYPEQLTTDMAKHGYGAEWSKLFWRAHWQLPSITQGFEMMHRTIIKPEDMAELLRLQDIPPPWRKHLMDMSYRTLTRVDIRRMHDMGILDDDQVRESYRDYGYSPENAEYMLQFTKAYNGQDPTTASGRTLELSRSVIIQTYRKGIITRPEAETRLQSVGYDTDDSTLLLALADWQGELDRTPTYYNEHHRDVKAIVERAYSRRLLGTQEAHDALVRIGYSESESELLLATVDWWYSFELMEAEQKRIGDAYANRSIDRTAAIAQLGAMNIPSQMQEQLLSEWDSERDVRYRKLTEAQYRRAAIGEIITTTQYREELRGLGYTEGDINIAVSMYLE